MRVAVVGGGLQGVAVALELAERGCQVDVFEREPCLLNRASRWNEGKVHLGFVYANDPSLRTARLMTEGALHFSSWVRRWLDADTIAASLSEPFVYAVPESSLLPPDEIAAHLASVAAGVRAREDSSGARYLGGEGARPPVALTACERRRRFGERTTAAWRTGERCIDPWVLCDALREAVAAQPRIETFTNAAVTRLGDTAGGPAVSAAGSVEATDLPYDHVVNASWESLLALNSTAFPAPTRPWLWRYKYGAFFQRSAGSPAETATLVLGEYGDVVTYRNGRAYLSWYPVARTGVSRDLEPPAAFGAADAEERRRLARRMVAGLAPYVPHVACMLPDLDEPLVEGGVIFSWGRTDIADPHSEVHTRHDVGITTRRGRFHSVNTGKWTLAPLFAHALADRIAACP